MRLKKLEISGFKSFAHKTNLEFPVEISAVVGPNGSGKSNVVDAIRWVLGEQSFKNLRSKSSVDLIWAGSQTKPAQGKASVNLYFDNSDGFFPIDFEELIIGRKVYRDGANEYYLNDSQVRLKDITELLARSKLGLRGHSIVNQGSADEILRANSEERRSILEEALGLREFQLKKSEAETKLLDTSANLEKTQGLLGEISPHLRSLKRQVDRFKKRDNLIVSLSNLENRYFSEKINGISLRKNKNQEEKRRSVEEISNIRADFEVKEKLFEVQTASIFKFGEKTQIDDNLNKLNIERQNVTRELGRIEGLIESARRNASSNVKTVEAILTIKIKYWSKRLNAVLELNNIAGAKEIIKNVAEEIKTVGSYFERNEVDKILAIADLPDFKEIKESPYEKDKETLKIKLEKIENQIKLAQSNLLNIRNEERDWQNTYLAAQKELESARRGYILAEKTMREFDLEDEKIKLAESDLKSEMWSAGKNYDDFAVVLAAENKIAELLNFSELQNNIIKLRREIADIGNVDEEMVREYEETNRRHEFLTREISDLSCAIESLRNMIKDLAGKISGDFEIGMERINNEFNRYFRLMFGGGSAKLAIDSSAGSEDGVDINISIPQKRIKDLNLLSGGERSLVSIALLFAIVSASQPPFLILDEIDAALDESNAARFAKVLKDLAKGTQFVLITHNRATMEAAKVLYGVAMDSDGISKLFSLKLEEVA